MMVSLQKTFCLLSEMHIYDYNVQHISCDRDSFSWQMMGVFQACKPMTRLFGQGRHSMMASKEHLQSVLSFL
jgi:hypothetical protein